ncbi:MAG: sialidase family protein [Kiritimatiellia bacterium]|nr:sialidase family protein [Kiritimatiellia bacterium]
MTLAIALVAWVALAGSVSMLQAQDKPREVPGNWRRSDPLSAIYLPTESSKNDRCNQQVVGIVTKKGSYLVTWTMASVESKPDQRVAISRSIDRGKSWSDAQIIAGDSETYPGAASYSWLFQVPKTGRIYCFYLKNDPSVVTVRRDITGWLKWQYSDDDGQTWHRVDARFDMGRGEWTSADPNVPTSFIGIYAPHTTSWGDVLFSFARYGLQRKGDRKYANWQTEVYFLRLDNIITQPDPENLTFSILPDTPQGLRIKRSNGLFWGNEPSWIELSDGRLMTAIRTKNDAVYYALSSDRAQSWTPPEPLRFGNGEIVRNPNAPCPMVKRHDGRVVLMFHNAKQSSTFGPRNPIWISVGAEDPEAVQPLRFGAPIKFLEVDGRPPLGTTHEQIATYSTLVEHERQLLLFYNDSKHWVLFRHVPENLLESHELDMTEQPSNKPNAGDGK